MSKIKQYEISDGKLKRKREFCPECKLGVFLAEHNNRSSCGKCGYTKMKE